MRWGSGRDGEDLVPDRGELGTVPGRVDVRHDIAAVCGPDLIQIALTGDVQFGAVCRQTGAEPCGCPGGEGASCGGSAHQNGGGLVVPDKVFQHSGIRFDPEVSQFGLIVHKNFIGAVLQQHFRFAGNVCPDQQTEDRFADFCRQFLCFADEFQRHGVDAAILHFRNDCNTPPLAFIHGRFDFIFHELKHAIAFFDAETAHFACGTDGKLSLRDFNGAEGAEFRQFFLLSRSFVLMDSDLCHTLPQLL